MIEFAQSGARTERANNEKNVLGTRLGFSGPMTVITAWKSIVELETILMSAQGPKDEEPNPKGLEEAL